MAERHNKTRSFQKAGDRLVVYGGGGHGVVVAEAAMTAGWSVVGFVDDQLDAAKTESDRQLLERPVWASLAEVDRADDVHIIVAVGDNHQRGALIERLLADQWQLATVVHAAAVVSPSASIAAGVFVSANSVIQGRADIGQGAIINTASVIEHDVQIGALAHVAPGAILTGNVRVGDRTLVGAGTVVRPGVQLAEAMVVGAGSVVVKDWTVAGEVIAGQPAVRLNQK